MRSQSTFGVHFIIRVGKNNKDEARIFARIAVNGKRVEVSLKHSILPENWNNAKGLAKGNAPSIRQLNTYLEQVRSRLTECYQELSLKKQLFTAETIKNLYCGEIITHITYYAAIILYYYCWGGNLFRWQIRPAIAQ